LVFESDDEGLAAPSPDGALFGVPLFEPDPSEPDPSEPEPADPALSEPDVAAVPSAGALVDPPDRLSVL